MCWVWTKIILPLFYYACNNFQHECMIFSLNSTTDRLSPFVWQLSWYAVATTTHLKQFMLESSLILVRKYLVRKYSESLKIHHKSKTLSLTMEIKLQVDWLTYNWGYNSGGGILFDVDILYWQQQKGFCFCLFSLKKNIKYLRKKWHR